MERSATRKQQIIDEMTAAHNDEEAAAAQRVEAREAPQQAEATAASNMIERAEE